ncbi:hypothetical protein ACFLUX_02565 [Chloroflexota bacterium]
MNWKSLAGRKGDKGGLYLFARFEHEPPLGPADPLEKCVVYIGQSYASFKSRWHLFYRGLNDPMEAKLNPERYPRALRYMKLFGEDSPPPHVANLPWEQLKKAFLEPGSCPLLDMDIARYRSRYTTDDFLNENQKLILGYFEQRLIMLYSCFYGKKPAIQENKGDNLVT